MATLKEFEEALRENGMANALAILDRLKQRDREMRSAAPARRVSGRKMTAELAREVLRYHATTGMTQQEIAFKVGVNQGRVNEVIKHGNWLGSDPSAPELIARDKAMDRLQQRAKARRSPEPIKVAKTRSPGPGSCGDAAMKRPYECEAPASRARPHAVPAAPMAVIRPRIVSAQLAFLDL